MAGADEEEGDSDDDILLRLGHTSADVSPGTGGFLRHVVEDGR